MRIERKEKERLRIAVCESCIAKSTRDRMSGVLRFVAEHDPPWYLSFMPSAYTNSTELECGDARPDDGMIITGYMFEKMMLKRQTVPARHIVIIETRRDVNRKLPGNAVRLAFDNDGCACRAAELLIKRGLENFAYVDMPSSSSEAPISRRRGEAFKAYLEEKGFECTICSRKEVRGNWAVRLQRLADELAALPRPCGVMAYNDERAREVIDACNLAGLKIPEQIQVVGVDNDVRICESMRPRLTSIEADFVGGGMRAAELLDLLIRNGRKSMRGDYTYGTFTVVERDTTIDVKGSARLVTAAQKIIREKACSGITPQSIAAGLNVSRRLIELRFREVLDVGVAEAIRTEKLKEVCRRLKDTNHPIDEISYDCGFETPTHLKALFRKTFGMTMRNYRAQNSQR